MLVPLPIETYGYDLNDVVIMLDDSSLKEPYIPTYDNIVRLFKFIIYAEYSRCYIVILQLREIDTLVQGAQPDDHFFFHCAWLCLSRSP
jgi:hypothetical protein